MLMPRLSGLWRPRQPPPALWPALRAEGRQRWLGMIVLLALLQALSAGLVAVGVRGSFQALHDRSGLPVGAVLTILAAGLAFAGLRAVERVQAERLGQHFAHSLRLALLGHLATLPHETLVWRHHGHLMQRLGGDMSAMRHWAGRGAARLLSATICLPLLSLLLVLWFPPALALGVLVPALAALLLTLPLALGLRRPQRQLARARSRLSASLAERLPHLQALRSAGRQRREALLLDRLGQRVQQAAVRRQTAAARLRAAPDLFRAVALAWVLALSFWTGAAPADAAACLAALGLMLPIVRDLGAVGDRHVTWRLARQRLWRWLSLPGVPPARTAAGSAAADTAEANLLVLDRIGFGAVSGFSARIAPGRRIVLTGEPGSGKSHLVRILARLTAPDSGRVLTGRPGGRPAVVRQVSAQSPILSGSLRRALTLGARRRPDDARLLATAHRFALTRLLDRLGGLDGRIAENGANLTGSERKRVLLVRAALCDADLLLVDDLDDLLEHDTHTAWAETMGEMSPALVCVSRDRRLQALADDVWRLGPAQVDVAIQGCER